MTREKNKYNFVLYPMSKSPIMHRCIICPSVISIQYDFACIGPSSTQCIRAEIDCLVNVHPGVSVRVEIFSFLLNMSI